MSEQGSVPKDSMLGQADEHERESRGAASRALRGLRREHLSLHPSLSRSPLAPLSPSLSPLSLSLSLSLSHIQTHLEQQRLPGGIAQWRFDDAVPLRYPLAARRGSRHDGLAVPCRQIHRVPAGQARGRWSRRRANGRGIEIIFDCKRNFKRPWCVAAQCGCVREDVE